MRTLVTGGAGFIGSALAARLLARGEEVVVFDNLTSGHRSRIPTGAAFVEGDLRDAHALLRACTGVSVIFHLGASVGNRRGLENPTNDGAVNALGTVNVLEAARFNRCRKIVYSSSAAIFGEPRVLPIPVDHPTRPLTPYGVSKLAGEQYALAYAALYGIDAVCLRYFNVYGPGQTYDPYGNVIPLFLTEALAGRPLTIFGDGQQTRDFVAVDDVVEANVLAEQADGVTGAFNIGSGAAVTINALAELILRLSPQSVPVRHGPERPGDVRSSVADISAAATVLGYRPAVSLQDGLRSCFEWMSAREKETVS